MNQPGKNKRLVFARKSCVVATEIALAMMAAQFAYAQVPARGERIEVTGTRIPLQQSVESTSPLAIISAEDIKIEGQRNVENLLNNMPQVFADQGGSYSNGASGTANVNLRGLGADRTLVLVNGKRLPPGSPQSYAADLNQIPAPLIERIEVLTGGASAVYGSDAIAGVVNFIMKSNFEGVQLDANYGYYMHEQHNAASSALAAAAAGNPTQYQVPSDKSRIGESIETSLLLGGNFGGGKGNATVFFGYKDDKPILQADYDYSACALGGGTSFSCVGSGTSFPGRFLALTGPNAGSSFTVANAQGGVRPYVGATDSFNFGPYNYFQRPSERYTANVAAHYDINPHVRAYGTFNFHDDSTLAVIAPSGLFGGTETVPSITLRGDNPMLSAAWRNALGLTTASTSTAELLIFRRNLEGGGRADDLRHTSFRTVAGVKGDILKHWDYDIFMQTGKVLLQETYRNDFSATRVARSLDVVTNPATGNPVCRSFLDGTDRGCVPWNIFSLGGVTPEALTYVSTPGLSRGSTEQKVQGATLSGDLGVYGLKLPGASSGISVAGGIERRVEKLNFEVDTAFSTGDLTGQGGATPSVSGQYTVREAFAEARIPILEGRGRGQLLSVNGSYRYSDYNLGFQTDSYGGGVEFAPVQAVKLRGSYQRAVRAPNVIDLFTPNSLGLFDIDIDPCAGPSPSATLAQCLQTGVTAAQYGSPLLESPAGQYNQITGGSTTLKPEKANSFTFGLVFTPTRNLSATIDYFNIEVEDVIDNIDASIILNQCLTAGQFCDLIQRDRLGTLWATPTGFVRATNVNLGKRKTSGVDVAVSYNQPIGGWGGLGFNFVGTYLREMKEEPIPGLGVYDCVGLYHADACSSATNPEWRHKFRVTWSSPWNLNLAVTWRHFDEVKSALGSSPLLPGAAAATDAVLGARDYLDLAFSWAATKQITVQGGINNVLDRDPPLSAIVGAGAGNGNTFPQVYDALGRKIFVGATLKF